MFTMFLVSLAASVVGHYVCKWLEKKLDNDSHK